MKGKLFDDVVADLLRDDPALAIEILNSIFEEGSQGELFTALRQIAKSQATWPPKPVTADHPR